MSLEERVQVLPKFKPEMATFNMGSMNYGLHFIAESYERKKKEFRFEWEKPYLEASKNSVFKNTYEDLEYILQVMEENKVKPECEIYDLGMIYNTTHLVDRKKAAPASSNPIRPGSVGGGQG